MHRLVSLGAVMIGAAFLANVAVAAGAPKRVSPDTIDPASARITRAESPAQRLRTARDLRAQWRPGVASSNVKITGVRLRNPGLRGGEKGGTEDINIGVGELQECTISKSMDAASPLLAQAAKRRTRLPEVVLSGRDSRGNHMIIKMKNVYITSYQTGGSGDRPMESLALNFTKIEFKNTGMGPAN